MKTEVALVEERKKDCLVPTPLSAVEDNTDLRIEGSVV